MYRNDFVIVIVIAIVFQADTASIIAIGATADLFSRIFLAVTAIFIQVPARYIYLSGALFTVFVRFGKTFKDLLLSPYI